MECDFSIIFHETLLAGIYLLKVNNKDTRTTQVILVFLLLSLNTVIAGWGMTFI